jgi:hypothetical protein
MLKDFLPQHLEIDDRSFSSCEEEESKVEENSLEEDDKPSYPQLGLLKPPSV